MLAGTLGTAMAVGLRMAQRAVEQEVGARTLDLATATVANLRRTGPSDDDAVSEELASTIRMHRGVGLAQMVRTTPGRDADFVAAHLTRGGVNFTRWHGPSEIPTRTQSFMDGRTRSWSVTVPFEDAKGLRAALTMSASLTEADNVVRAERSVLAITAAVAALLLLLAAYQVLGRLIIRRIESLAAVMHRVESGDSSAAAVDTHHDELAYLARGFNAMLTRLRGFNAELESRIDAATRDLARKNRALEELNDLLLTARRDLSAKERLAALGQLSGTIAHELGNPLNAISVQLQLMARRSDLPEAARNEIGVAQGEVTRMTGIIRRFLDSSRGLSPAPERTQLTALVDEAIDLTLSAEARTRVAVERRVAPEAETILCDPALVRHVLTNLLGNALDATAGKGTLIVTGAREGSDVVLAVADSGSGLSPEVKRRIFDPFFTTKPPGRGTGLGLAICKEIARAMHGRLDVESELGRGSTFTLRFPAPMDGKT